MTYASDKRRFAWILGFCMVVAACGSDGPEREGGSGGDDTVTTTGGVVETSSLPAASPTTTQPSGDTPPASADLTVAIEGLEAGEVIPVAWTCDGANEVPSVAISGVPDAAVELALIVDDPDAPTDTPFVHWVVAGIDPAGATFDGTGDVRAGANDLGTAEWFGPCPPPADDPHEYRWRLFAVSAPLDSLADGFDAIGLEDAMAGLIVAEAEATALYDRQE